MTDANRAMAPIWSQSSTGASPDGHFQWRRQRLIAAGFDAPLAGRLADDDGVDLHELLVLLDRGCPPALAARILAPLDAPMAAR
jgi:hypothetical protein